ncbi:hypothetical protein DQ238_15160 [Geodermatophilus sp. TF02-6]|uniref:alpha/beta-hydrolase family protein n=1 Tax=Geodermatophilus sp. TF02-6 TaxID=2250575 RepID=UPI000DE80756|nr:hypothetical protein DQ238_15160 [Geodermatophilus sp. TF02-6]
MRARRRWPGPAGRCGRRSGRPPAAPAGALREGGPVDGCLLAGRPGSAHRPPVPGCTEVRNDDDPVGWWRPGLLAVPTPGLPWFPVGTFWQVTGALVAALDQPPGHGHRYGASLAPAWAALLRAGGRSAPTGGRRGWRPAASTPAGRLDTCATVTGWGSTWNCCRCWPRDGPWSPGWCWRSW